MRFKKEYMCVLMLLVRLAAGAATTMEIGEHLGMAWTDELVHYRLEFPRGEVFLPDAVRVELAGKGPIPGQLSDVQRHVDGSIAACKVWFKVDLPAGETAGFTITPGERGPAAEGASAVREDASITLASGGASGIGIRLPAGSRTYDWPADPADVPGPVQGLRLASGRTTGPGRWEIPFRIRSYEAEITARGPLFAEARVRYVFDTGYWTFTARVVHGSPLILVEEELDNGWNPQGCGLPGTTAYDDVDRFYSIPLNTGGFQPIQGFFTGRVDTPDYHDLLHNAYPDEVKAIMWQPSTSGATVHGYSLAFDRDRTDYYLVGWPTWHRRVGVAVRFIEPERDAVAFVAVNTPRWRNQMSIRFRVNRRGELLASLPLQVYEQGWLSDGYSRISPNATGRTLDVPDTAARRSYGIMLTRPENESEAKLGSLLQASAKAGPWSLDTVKDWVLAWDDPLSDTAWAAENSEQAERLLKRMRAWAACKRATANFGIWSMHDYYIVSHWTSAHHPHHPLGTGQGDLGEVIDDPAQITSGARRELRRLAAFQAYVMNSAAAFPWGTGSHLGNPNMSIMAMNARVHAGLLVRDHPAFMRWGAWTTAFMRDYIERFTRESGAPYECPHYTLGVTLRDLATANETLRAAGIGDAFETPRLKKSLRFSFNWLLPPDLRFNGLRTVMPIGNTSYQSVPPEMARPYIEYYRERDAELAGQMQWAANQTLPDNEQLTLVESRVPELGSLWARDYGVFFRHGFGTPHETYFHMMAGNTLGHYESTDHMVYTLYAKGHPIHLHFGNGYFPMFGRPWLRNGISVDHRVHWGYERNFARVETAAFTPQTDYAHAALDIDELLMPCGEYPTPYGEPDPDPVNTSVREQIPLMTWRRQVLFLKDANPAGPNYFVLRDSFTGRPVKPTDLNLWFLANAMRREGDVFHFDGQLPVDMDVFVHTPANPEPHTDTFGHVQQPYRRLTGDNLDYYPDGVRQERQTLLRLEQPPGEGYLVVLYPRLKEDDPPAAYTRLGEHAVKVETPLSTDYIVLNSYPAKLQSDDVFVRSRSAAVRLYRDGRIHVVNHEGEAEIRVAARHIAGHGPFSVELSDGRAQITRHDDNAVVDVN